MSQQINQMNQMNQQMNQMNQINQMNYDYRRGPNHSAPQQWSNVPPGMMQSTPQPVPPPSNPYNTGPLGPGMRPSVPDQSGWQKPGIHMMNGDNRMPPSYQNQMSNMVSTNNDIKHKKYIFKMKNFISASAKCSSCSVSDEHGWHLQSTKQVSKLSIGSDIL